MSFDLEKLKDRAEALIEQVGRESKRHAALAKLKIRVLDLERRMNNEFRTVGERAWELHSENALSADNLTGAFDELERLSGEIAQCKDDIEELSTKPEEELDDEPLDEAERQIEDEPEE